MYGRPVSIRPRTAITTVPPARITLRPAVVTASTTASWRLLAGVQRRAEAGEDEQRVVDADADPDQARHRGRPVGHVDDVRQQDDQPARGDAEADQRDHQRQPGGDHRAERDQQHDRGAEEPEALGARGLLRGVDRIAAQLDLHAVAAVGLGGGDQLLAGLLRDVPAVDRQRQRGRPDRAVPREPDGRLLGDVVDLPRLGEERVDALARGGLFAPSGSFQTTYTSPPE